jgi:hypothetical protein
MRASGKRAEKERLINNKKIITKRLLDVMETKVSKTNKMENKKIIIER